MSFRRLLAVGKSVHGFKHEFGRFKMPEQRWLPDFGPSRFSFEHLKPDGDGVLKIAGHDGGVNENELPSSQDANETPPESSGFRWASFGGAWISRLFCRQSESTPQVERYVQAELSLEEPELSLETVTVQRNDLSESDFEFAVRGPKEEPERGAGKQSALVASVAGLLEIGRAARSLIQADRV